MLQSGNVFSGVVCEPQSRTD